MNKTLIQNLNSAVGSSDIVIHAGDFCWKNRDYADSIIKQLKGNHIFLRGSHDSWLPGSAQFIWEKEIDGQMVVVCHYSMRTWRRSRYGSWQLYAHSHGGLPPIGKQHDIGVDNNNLHPVSYEQIKEIMKGGPDNLVEFDRMKYYKPGHLYECYMDGGEKRLSLFERAKCSACNHIWNQNQDGGDCPKCGDSSSIIISSSDSNSHMLCNQTT